MKTLFQTFLIKVAQHLPFRAFASTRPSNVLEISVACVKSILIISLLWYCRSYEAIFVKCAISRDYGQEARLYFIYHYFLNYDTLFSLPRERKKKILYDEIKALEIRACMTSSMTHFSLFSLNNSLILMSHTQLFSLSDKRITSNLIISVRFDLYLEKTHFSFKKPT